MIMKPKTSILSNMQGLMERKQKTKKWMYSIKIIWSLQNLIEKMMGQKNIKNLFLSADSYKTPSFETVSSNYEKSAFMADVEKIKSYIKAGDIFQGVLSQKFEVSIKADAFELYRVLRIVNPSPYMYYMKLLDREIVGRLSGTVNTRSRRALRNPSDCRYEKTRCRQS